MQIEVKGRNVHVNDELRELAERKFRKVAAQVSDLARMEIELREERNPAIAESQVATVTLYLKGATLHAEGSSRELHHSIKLCSLELSRQVKRHNDKRRHRREARQAPPQPALLALTYDHRIVDGREAVSFLRQIKDIIEDPIRILIEI